MDWLSGLVGRFGYPGLFAAIILENLVPWIPSELILPFAGYLAFQGLFHPALVVTWATAGSVTSAYLIYALGFAIGRGKAQSAVTRISAAIGLKPETLRLASAWFRRKGNIAVLLCRFVPGVRSFISVPAGMSGMSLYLFGGYTLLGSAVWNLAFTLIGFYGGNMWQELTKSVYARAWQIVGAVALAFLVGYLFRRSKKANA